MPFSRPAGDSSGTAAAVLISEPSMRALTAGQLVTQERIGVDRGTHQRFLGRSGNRGHLQRGQLGAGEGPLVARQRVTFRPMGGAAQPTLVTARTLARREATGSAGIGAHRPYRTLAQVLHEVGERSAALVDQVARPGLR